MSGKILYRVSKIDIDLLITEAIYSPTEKNIDTASYKYFEKKQEAIIYLGNIINNTLIFHKKAVLEYEKKITEFEKKYDL